MQLQLLVIAVRILVSVVDALGVERRCPALKYRGLRSLFSSGSGPGYEPCWPMMQMISAFFPIISCKSSFGQPKSSAEVRGGAENPAPNNTRRSGKKTNQIVE